MTGLLLGLALVGVGVAAILWLPLLWRIHRPRRPEGVTQQWLNDHEQDGDR